MQYSFNIRYFEVLLLRIFRIFAGRGAILWTGMSEVVRRRIFRVYSDVSDFILKGKKVASGIYMVMTATEEGDKGVVCKIAIIN